MQNAYTGVFIKKFSEKTDNFPLTETLILIKKNKAFGISCVNWKEYPYCPKVFLKAGHTKKYLYLYFNVLEKTVMAKRKASNQNVFMDSCVEFFVASSKGYFNFEFNCIGTKLAGFGTCRESRKLFPTSIITEILTHPSLGKKTFSETKCKYPWELLVAIPKYLFTEKSEYPDKLLANFYKCGDELSNPHYISRFPVKTLNPDFHRPEFFGPIYFGK